MVDSLQIHAAGKSDVGQRRQINEDSYLINNPCFCFSVADGVGGAAAGEVASQLFVSVVSEAIKAPKKSGQDAASAIKQIFHRANSKVLTCSQQKSEHQGMACTAELLLFHQEQFTLGHVGDSRTYRFRGNGLTQLTRDHSLVQEQLDRGQISTVDAQTHRYRNVILRAVGSEETIDVDLVSGKVRAGDTYLLCSDGLTDMVEDNDIAQCLRMDSRIESKVALLIDMANQAGGRDNITVLLVQVI